MKEFFDTGLLEIDKFMLAIDDFARLSKVDFNLAFKSNLCPGEDDSQLKNALKPFRSELGKKVSSLLNLDENIKLVSRNKAELMLNDIQCIASCLASLFNVFKKDEAKDKSNDLNTTLNGSQTEISKIVNTILSEVNELRSQLAAVTSANVYKVARIKKLESSNVELTARLTKLEVEKFNYTEFNVNNKNKRKTNSFAAEDEIEQPAPKASSFFLSYELSKHSQQDSCH